MQRTRLNNYRGLILSPDTAQALRTLEQQASDAGKWRVLLTGPEPKAGWAGPRSLIPAGREVHFHLTHASSDPQTALDAAWGFAVPLGFTPKTRYPNDPHDDASTVFHFYGSWAPLVSRLLAEGRGHLAWPSLCCAAQVDVGTWAGDKTEERYIQSQLHRLGKNPGPVDGIIGPRTAQAIEALNLGRASRAQVLEHLRTATPPKISEAARVRGHVVVPGRVVRVEAHGGVKATDTGNGAALTIDGPGRVIVDVGPSR